MYKQFLPVHLNSRKCGWSYCYGRASDPHQMSQSLKITSEQIETRPRQPFSLLCRRRIDRMIHSRLDHSRDITKPKTLALLPNLPLSPDPMPAALGALSWMFTLEMTMEVSSSTFPDRTVKLPPEIVKLQDRHPSRCLLRRSS
jgi:hypothetical protein